MTGQAAAAAAIGFEDQSAQTDRVDRARTLVTRHFQPVWRLLRRLGVPESDAEDAAQQVFIVATARLAEIPEERERPFLYAAALRVAATANRTRLRRQRWISLADEDAAASGASIDEQIERYEALAFLDDVLANLDDELRRVFVLSDIEEMTASEVSELLGMPVGTVASRLRRARRQFDKCATRLRAERERDQ
jgi:RNA polymerase sigma-70 factor, ECF subfamily